MPVPARNQFAPPLNRGLGDLPAMAHPMQGYLGQLGTPGAQRAFGNPAMNPGQNYAAEQGRLRSMRPGTEEWYAQNTGELGRLDPLSRARAEAGMGLPSEVRAANEGAIRGTVDMFTGTGVLGRAVDAALSGAARGAAGKVGQFFDPRQSRSQVNTFAGPGAKTADLGAMQQAKELAEAGFSREQIHKSTGWFQGVDGDWRFEIPDTGLSLSSSVTDRLTPSGPPGAVHGAPQDLAPHPELYAAYPQLGTDPMMAVQRWSGPRAGAATGSYMPGTPGDAQFFGRSPEIKAQGDDVPGVRSTAAHELQHGVQDIEGFAQGGSPSMMHDTREGVRAVQSRIYDIKEEMKLRRLSGTIGRHGRRREGKLKSTDRELAMDLEKHQQTLKGFEDLGTPYEQYNRLAGEVEARATQARLPLTREQRASRPPWLDYDVAEADQTVRRGPR